jgi:hypothetical protein
VVTTSGAVSTSLASLARLLCCRDDLGSVRVGEGDVREPSWRDLEARDAGLLDVQERWSPGWHDGVEVLEVLGHERRASGSSRNPGLCSRQEGRCRGVGLGGLVKAYAIHGFGKGSIEGGGV